jgi:hypothetical protein
MSVTMLALAPAKAPANVTSHSASIQFLGQGQLQEDGGVLVTLSYSCAPSAFGQEGKIFVTLEQPGAAGVGAAIAQCDSAKHKVTVGVGFPIGSPFTPGTATAKALVKNETDSSTAEKQQLLKIR